jgi:hypothetical protein
MSARLRRNAQILRLLHRATPAVRKRILQRCCSIDFVSCVCECVKNLLKGVVPLSVAQIAALRRRKKTLRLLAVKKTSHKKRKHLIQSGGFLGTILGPIVSVLGRLFDSSDG